MAPLLLVVPAQAGEGPAVVDDTGPAWPGHRTLPHWENRRLAVAELASLQTFPRGLAFAGNRGSVQKQLGNAVPSLLAEVIARAIAAQFFDVPVRQRPTFAA